MWSKGVVDYDSGVCSFKEVKTYAKLNDNSCLLNQKYRSESIDK